MCVCVCVCECEPVEWGGKKCVCVCVCVCVCECEPVEWGGEKCVCVCVCVNVKLWRAGGRRGCVCLSCCGGQGQFACTNAAGRYLTLHLFSTCKM